MGEVKKPWLIDANDLLALVKKNAPFIYSILAPITLLCPAIDAVPVVRCKDCKHRGDPNECFMCFTAVEPVEGGQMYRVHDLTTQDGFCNRGEKRDLEE